ncbi:hypothetical protein FA13DRAFT_196836 [Coprinellus micaceus]|uniref:Uncharacterized protein n=1 Tax=Coprinellus micaceus TaxID=71717 RepID=A0A4Y7TGH7_COPMI|nr:hypothetical protein FA13DRAFT_196836 [Coprinellus micaceus]
MATSRQVCLTIPTWYGVKVALERVYEDVGELVLEHSKVFSIVCLFLAFQPNFPVQVVRFLLAIPKAILVGFLSCVGFGGDGVREDSLAAYYQSRQHGGYVPAGSWFSSSQSYGTLPPRVFVVEVEPEGENVWLSLMRCVWFGCFLYLWYV